jgi:hypothetical protein
MSEQVTPDEVKRLDIAKLADDAAKAQDADTLQREARILSNRQEGLERVMHDIVGLPSAVVKAETLPFDLLDDDLHVCASFEDLPGKAFTSDFDSFVNRIMLIGVCPACGKVTAGQPIRSLEELGVRLREPFTPFKKHQDRCTPEEQPVPEPGPLGEHERDLCAAFILWHTAEHGGAL